MSKALSSYYSELRDWLANKTLGERSTKTRFRHYDYHLWLPIKKMMESALTGEESSTTERDLLLCQYTGDLFRVQYYDKQKRAHVYPLGRYQSWSMESGLETLSKLGGKLLLIHGYATPSDYAISTLELLLLMQPEIWPQFINGEHELSRYRSECEVVMPIRTDNVDEILVVDAEHLCEWRTRGIPLPKEKWFRNNWR